MFPKDADNSHSYALKSVWEKPDDFAAAAKKLQQLASKLAETAKTGDVKASLAAFADMGRNACGACHKEFRAAVLTVRSCDVGIIGLFLVAGALAPLPSARADQAPSRER